MKASSVVRQTDLLDGACPRVQHAERGRRAARDAHEAVHEALPAVLDVHGGHCPGLPDRRAAVEHGHMLRRHVGEETGPAGIESNSRDRALCVDCESPGRVLVSASDAHVAREVAPPPRCAPPGGKGRDVSS